jgi:hypothetical protein
MEKRLKQDLKRLTRSKKWVHLVFGTGLLFY